MSTHDVAVRAVRAFAERYGSQLGNREPGLFDRLANEFFDLMEQPGPRRLGELVSSEEMQGILEPSLGRVFAQPVALGPFPVVRIPEAGVTHGAAVWDGWMLVFFWCERHRSGLCMVSRPGPGQTFLLRLSHIRCAAAPPFTSAPIPGEH